MLPAWQWIRGGGHESWLKSFRRENYLLGGRGTRKTGHLVAKSAIVALALHPYAGAVSYLTEQTQAKVSEILLPIFRLFVDPHAYQIRPSRTGADLDVHWVSGHITRLRTRQAKLRRSDPPFRGPSAVYIGHDEICRDPAPLAEDYDPIAISRAMLRGFDAPMCLDVTTTPVKGWVYHHVRALRVAIDGEGDELTNAHAGAWHLRTRDVDPALYRYLVGSYSPAFASQELEARWTPLLGRVWTDYLDAEWPVGNRHWHTFDPTRPTYWGVDLGSGSSAWNICQVIPAVDRYGARQPGYGESVIVTVGESNPQHQSTAASIDELIAKFGRPARVYVGAGYRDGGQSGVSAERDFILRNLDVELISGDMALKDVQHSHACSFLKSATGLRRWCLSQEPIRLHEHRGARRGIEVVLESDAWPAEDSLDFLAKDKRSGGPGLEDARDAWLYLLAGLSPPKWHALDEYRRAGGH